MAVDKFSSFLDNFLVRLQIRRTLPKNAITLETRMVNTLAGPVRVYDSGAIDQRPCVIFVPDGPNIIEHYEPLIALLAAQLRVVCFDMPGFGYSPPDAGF